MEGVSILWMLLIGLAAGAIAGVLVMRRRSFGIIINIVVGVAGSFIGGWVYGLLGVSASNVWGILLGSVAGAVVLLWMLSLLRTRKMY